MANGAKSAALSTTIQGAAIAGLPAIDALLVGLGIFDVPLLSGAATAVVSAVGAVMAIWGRFKAAKKIKLF